MRRQFLFIIFTLLYVAAIKPGEFGGGSFSEFRLALEREHKEQQKLDREVKPFITEYAQRCNRESSELTKEEHELEVERIRKELTTIQGFHNWPKRSALYQVAASRGFNSDQIAASVTHRFHESALYHAIRSGDTSCARFLLDHKADIHQSVKPAGSKGPLLRYARTVSGAQLLLAYNANLNAKNEDGETCLWHFVRNLYEKSSSVLLSFYISQGIDICAVNNHNETPLHSLSYRFVPTRQEDQYSAIRLVSAGVPLGMPSTDSRSMYQELNIVEQLKVNITLGINVESSTALLKILEKTSKARRIQLWDVATEYVGSNFASMICSYDDTVQYDQSAIDINRLAIKAQQRKMILPPLFEKYHPDFNPTYEEVEQY